MLHSDPLAQEFNAILNAAEIFAPFQPLDAAVSFYAPLAFNVRDLRLSADNFERASANFYRAGNQVILAPSNAPRFERAALLMEAAATNLAYPSNDFSQWDSGSSPVLRSNVASAPDGSMAAWEIEDTGGPPGNDRNQIARLFTGVSGSYADTDRWAVSFFIRKTLGPQSFFPAIGFSMTGGPSGSNVHCVASVDTTTGQAVVVPALGWTPAPVLVDWAVEDFGDWWRFTVFADNNGASHDVHFARIYPAYSATFGGDPDSALAGSVTIWQADAVRQHKPSSTIEAPIAATARDADRLTYAPINFLSLSEGMCIFTLQAPSEVSGVDNRARRLLTFDDLQAPFAYYQTGRFLVDGGATPTGVDIDGGDIQEDTDYIVAIRWTGVVKQIGYFDPFSDTWVWGPEGSYSTFATGDDELTVCPPTGASADPVRMKDLYFYDDDKGRVWIEANHS